MNCSEPMTASMSDDAVDKIARAIWEVDRDHWMGGDQEYDELHADDVARLKAMARAALTAAAPKVGWSHDNGFPIRTITYTPPAAAPKVAAPQAEAGEEMTAEEYERAAAFCEKTMPEHAAWCLRRARFLRSAAALAPQRSDNGDTK